MARYIGKEMSRVDGVAKVTGKAKYAAEFKVPNLANGFLVMGSIAKGTIKSIDTTEASRAPGVIRIFTHENYPKLAAAAFCGLDPATSAERIMNPFPALQSVQPRWGILGMMLNRWRVRISSGCPMSGATPGGCKPAACRGVLGRPRAGEHCGLPASLRNLGFSQPGAAWGCSGSS